MVQGNSRLSDNGRPDPASFRPTGASEDRRTARRALIERAAVQCLSKHPYGTTTVQAIAKTAGIGVGLMYRDVASKEEILLLIFDHILTRYETEFDAVDFVGSPMEKLHAAMHRYFHIVASDIDRSMITYRESWQLSERARQQVKRREHSSNRPFEAILGEGMADGSMRPAPVGVMAYTIVSLAHAWALKGWYLRDVITLDDYIDTQFSMIAAYLTSEKQWAGMPMVPEPGSGAVSTKRQRRVRTNQLLGGERNE